MLSCVTKFSLVMLVVLQSCKCIQCYKMLINMVFFSERSLFQGLFSGALLALWLGMVIY